MKALILLAAVALTGCNTMDPYAAQNFQQGFMGALSIGAQQEQMRNQQRMMYAPQRPLSCTTRYVGANAYTDCF